ncbi:MAG: family 10 glycosylhydrolase [Candidatus Sericytochromatia bacterium]
MDTYNIISPKLEVREPNKANIDVLKLTVQKINNKIDLEKNSFSKQDYSSYKVKINQINKNINLLSIDLNNYKKTNSIKKILDEIREIQLEIMPSRTVETRGLYIDTDNIPTTKPEITKLIKEIKYANFNVIYPEVFRRGYTIFNNNIADTEQRFKDTNFNVLDFLISEAHKNNIDVYPWIWTFRVKSPLYSDYFLKKYPDLIAKRKVMKFEHREPLFLSPASPQARNLILKLLRVLTINYDIDGLLLDYIRYDETLSYDTITERNFKDYYYQKYNKLVPDDINNNPELLKELQFWREEQVTTLVKTANLMLKNIKPEMKIGVAIFRTEKEGRLLKMQDWRHWANNNYINFVCPMLYTDQVKDLNDWINSETDKNTRFDYLYPSLGAHRFYKADDIYPLIGLLHQRNVAGFNIFSLEHIGRENLPDLRKSIFKNIALIPEKNITKTLDYMVNNLSYKLEESNYKKFNIVKFKNLIKKKSYENIIKESEILYKDFSNNAYILDDLNYFIKIIKTEQRIESSKNNYIKPTEPPLPIYPLNN